MDLHRYLRAVRRNWWIVVLVTVLGAAGGYYQAARTPNLYAASVTFYVATPLDATNAYGSDQFAQDRANSYAELLSSQRFADLVRRESGVNLSGSDIASKISGTAKVDTVLVEANIQDTSLKRLRTIQRTVAAQFPDLVNQLETTDTVALRVVSTPPVSSAPIAPRTSISVIIGFAAGLVIGLLIAALRELIDTSVRSSVELERLAGVPLIGNIAHDTDAQRNPIATGSDGYSRRAEDFRQLRTNLEFVHTAEQAQAIAVTSSVAGEGKSSTAANIAATAAERGGRVLLVDADLRRPQIADYLGFDRTVGLTTLLTRRVDVDTAVRTWGDHGLAVLPSGQTPPNPSELLNSDGMRELMAELRTRYDLIVVDTPPVLAVTDAAVCSTFVDGVVVLYRYGKTRRANFVAALHALDAVNARIVGVVMNHRPRRGVDGAQYGSYDSYESVTTSGRRNPLRRRRGPKRRPAVVTPPPVPVPEDDDLDLFDDVLTDGDGYADDERTAARTSGRARRGARRGARRREDGRQVAVVEPVVELKAIEPEPAAPEPKVVEPEVVEPEVVEPEVVEPEPEAVEPEPEVVESEVVEPEVVEPEVVEPEPEPEPEAVEPEAVEPEAVEPEAVEPEAVEPEAVEPEPEPEAVEPEPEPEAVEPEPEPEAVEPEPEPEAVEPEAVEPEAVEPEAVEPEAVEPEAVEPEAATPGVIGSVPATSSGLDTSGTRKGTPARKGSRSDRRQAQRERERRRRQAQQQQRRNAND